MTPAAAKDSLRRLLLAQGGQRVTLKRQAVEVENILARISGFVADELVGDIDQGTRKVIMLNEGLGAFVPQKGDAIEFGGARITIETVDDQTRRVQGELIGYNITATG